MELKIEYLPIETLKPYENNAKVHTAEQIEQIKKSIEDYGMNDPIGIWHDTIVEGHGRLMACLELGYTEVPVVRLDHMSDEQRREYTLVHNQTTMNTGYDIDLLDLELDELPDFDAELYGFEGSDFDLSQNPYDNSGDSGSLQRDFLAPPFSVLDGRQGYWLSRKRWWKEQIQDEAQARDVTIMSDNINRGQSASILDPVLSEIILYWFAPYDGALTFDCFAGDTVFGYVAGAKGHKFTGIELREEQVAFNNQRTKKFGGKYICDDGCNVLDHIEESSQDLLFSCPPYFDLEVYSDKPNDASNQNSYEEFYKIIDTAFTNACKCLKEDRFAVIVVGNIRDKNTGGYYNFTGDIIETFTRNGLLFYNDMVLLDPIGSGGIRARNAMKNRKTTKVHQNVLVFYKGDADNIQKNFQRIEVQLDEGEDE